MGRRAFTGYLDASPLDGSGTDVTPYGGGSAEWDPILSADPYDS